MFLGEKFATPFSIFDTHAHYDDEVFDEMRDELLKRIGEKGVGCIINNSTDLESSAEKCLLMSEKYDVCYTAVGLHPELVETKGKELDEEKLRLLSGLERVVAIGEIGLDYHYFSDRKELQKSVFKKQCEIAKEQGLPVIVHDREAHSDTLEILFACMPKGVVHCFSGSVETALELVKRGFYIGIGGVLTFKNARKLVEVAEAVPLDKILLETDAPYLAPVPLRGKICNSAYIYYTAEKLAEIKGVTAEEVIIKTDKNARSLFQKIK